eukprot:m.48852 g.48852  ORF g.48852 m.48852 type:complete len:338 (-) comp20872_c0_seq1:335-1348(-)
MSSTLNDLGSDLMGKVDSTPTTLPLPTSILIDREVEVIDADLSGGLEKYPVPCRAQSTEPKPSLNYTVHNVGWGKVDLHKLAIKAQGCQCRDCNDSCPCSGTLAHIDPCEIPHTSKRRRTTSDSADRQDEPIYECHDGCDCTVDNCPNRLTQRGINVHVEVFFTSNGRGWGLASKQKIPRGSFVLCYNGEILPMAEAKARLAAKSKDVNSHNYILILREHNSSTVYNTHIDAEHTANAAHFINHSCDPNLEMQAVRGTCMVPVAALYASRDIQSGEELTFCYGGSPNKVGEDTLQPIAAQPLKPQQDDSGDTLNVQHRVCRCGANNCTGVLPFEDTF